LTYSYIDQENELPSNYHSAYVGDYLKHKINFRLTHRILFDLYASWDLQYFSRMGAYEVTATKEFKDYEDVFLTNLKLYYDIDIKYLNKIRVYAECSNLFDVEYRYMNELLQPGRWVKAGVNISPRF
jgi:iron complex outermembrane receptor protein